ncbi:hypothetical protein GGR56DRAFT_504490 [Xylariaceae sp. FL0804]|nr:hypothetical protein GGR56DRAFT_504490 [Xylariaceae sp. FL0804]
MADTFSPFKRLPLELRLIIWEYCLPCRLLVPRQWGPFCSPGPPLLTQVCRESRSVAYQFGGPCAVGFLDAHRRFSTTWHDTRRDIVLFSVFAVKPECPLFDNLWLLVQTIVVHDSYADLYQGDGKPLLTEWPDQPPYNDVLPLMRLARSCCPALRTIYILPSKDDEQCRVVISPESWDQKVSEVFFGQDSAVVIDLLDGQQVRKAAHLLQSDPEREAWLRLAHKKVCGGTYWRKTVTMCELLWLKKAYAQDKEAGKPAVLVENPWEIRDSQDRWVQAELARMPIIRPCVLFVKKDEAYVSNTRRTYRPEDRPLTLGFVGKSWQRLQ